MRHEPGDYEWTDAAERRAAFGAESFAALHHGAVKTG
jgi:hypothetical protein